MTTKQAKASPEWPHWKGVIDINVAGAFKKRVWDQAPRPTNKAGHRDQDAVLRNISEIRIREERWKHTSACSWPNDSNNR